MGSDASDGSVGREEATRGGSEGTAASRLEQRARAAAAREAGEAAGGEEGVAAAAERSSVGLGSGAALDYRGQREGSPRSESPYLAD